MKGLIKMIELEEGLQKGKDNILDSYLENTSTDEIRKDIKYLIEKARKEVFEITQKVEKGEYSDIR